MKRKILLVHHLDDVPHFGSDDEAAAFWETHEISEEYLADAGARGRIPERPAYYSRFNLSVITVER